MAAPPYTLHLATLLTAQLVKFTSLNRHQLPGHIANLNFWAAEVAAAVHRIDDYQRRHNNLRTAQAAYLKANQVTEYWLSEPEITNPPAPPAEIPASDRESARRALVAAWRTFLARCVREQLLTPEAATAASDAARVPILPEDLH